MLFQHDAPDGIAAEIPKGGVQRAVIRLVSGDRDSHSRQSLFA